MDIDNIFKETLIAIKNEDYISPSGGIIIEKRINRKRIRRLKRRLKKLSKTDYEKYKHIMKVLEYYILFQIIIE